MRVPESCEGWLQALRSGGEDEQCIAYNFLRDPCVPQDVEREFFERLARKGSTWDSASARSAAIDIVRDEPDRFTLAGRSVPDHRFQTIVRVEGASQLAFRLNNDSHTELLARFGLPKGRPFRDFSAADLGPILTWLREQPITVGNARQIVWVTDQAEIAAASGGPSELGGRLGLRSLDGEDLAIAYVYDRTANGVSPHVPRILDAPDEPRFEPVIDCDAEVGLTRAIDGGAGVPEAVHRRATIRLGDVHGERL